METTREDPAACLWWSGPPEEWLKRQLAAGPVRLAVLMERAELARISPHQLNLAKLGLGVEELPVGFGDTPWHQEWRYRPRATAQGPDGAR